MGKSSADHQKPVSRKKDGRLVWNHSTHIPGLIPILERLCQQDGIQTITPGVIGRVKGHSPKMQLRVSVPILGGYKIIARQGKTVQEVFILTPLAQDTLEAMIAIACKRG
ncbi:conserved hypothetical protein [Trichormus variabilis ATCC 29413]|uniref:Metal-binding protein n=2 Tax=Anabaena variabilis TaxID=264691 RepID=Q3M981_TRIV2|nr:MULTISPECIES: DUF2103 domain-containing protein [Nostocaceae]ABA22455.1 conserved hypothetical protein [Trichormus variabilis ATCC 29413]MBC1216806.1 metal-binding protein [Trichormus variabilis ARAD]MBC1254381.1 metal-binding protein [Trichormus variabilis V5]MBC1269590.1 metal-binding protein [Trichormus variabilis FSR]MBC1304417.1 metal-binding protein [Trichormus variabilis N2B]